MVKKKRILKKSKERGGNAKPLLIAVVLFFLILLTVASAANEREAREKVEEWKYKYREMEELRYEDRSIVLNGLRSLLSGEPIKVYRVTIHLDMTLVGDEGTLDGIMISVDPIDTAYKLRGTARTIPRELIRWSLRNVPRTFTSLTSELTDIINALEYCDDHYVDAIKWRISFGTEEIIVLG